MLYAFAILGIWIACGLYAYTGILGYFQRHYPNLAEDFLWVDRTCGIILGLLGPVGLFAGFVVCKKFKYGFKWW